MVCLQRPAGNGFDMGPDVPGKVNRNCQVSVIIVIDTRTCVYIETDGDVYIHTRMGRLLAPRSLSTDRSTDRCTDRCKNCTDRTGR